MTAALWLLPWGSSGFGLGSGVLGFSGFRVLGSRALGF